MNIYSLYAYFMRLVDNRKNHVVIKFRLFSCFFYAFLQPDQKLDIPFRPRIGE
jgi:hypothetical protein